MKRFPIAPEVCKDCAEGRHVMHVIHELADFHVTKEMRDYHGKQVEQFVIHGTAEDEDCLEDLINSLSLTLTLGKAFGEE